MVTEQIIRRRITREYVATVGRMSLFLGLTMIFHTQVIPVGAGLARDCGASATGNID
jgi:hypothetical protein